MNLEKDFKWRPPVLPPDIIAAAADEERAEETARIEEARKYAFIKSKATLPTLFKDVPILQEVNPQAGQVNIYQSLLKLADKPEKNSIMILGSSGTGKTFLAIAYLLQRAHQNTHREQFTYISAWDFVASKEPGGDRREINGTLLLDDLGAERDTKFTRSEITELINRRHNECAPTVITTNLGHIREKDRDRDYLGEITARYADRVTSRLVGQFKIFELNGLDLRMSAKRRAK